jgi:DNA-binding MarR family transcriptional regulator
LTLRKNYRDQVVVWLDDEQSRAEVTRSLARLADAGFIETVADHGETCHVITAKGRRHLRALQES